MNNPKDPYPRDLRDQLLEVTAACEATTALALALSCQAQQGETLLRDFHGLAQTLLARVNGESHPDRYLELLKDQLEKRLAAVRLAIQSTS